MIAVCGESLIDLVPEAGGGSGVWRAVPGGGPANAAVALSRLGVSSSLLCRLAEDTFGTHIRAHLEVNGVDLRWSVLAAQQSSIAVAGLDDTGSACFAFYLQGTADWQWRPGELPPSLPSEVRCLHAGSLAAVLPPGGAVLREWARAQRTDTVVSYDVNARPDALADAEAYRASVREWLDTAHVVKASDDDLGWLAPGEPPVEVMRGWMDRHGLQLGLITMGADGAVAMLPGEPHVVVPGIRVKVSDTVGAGDVFIAAVLSRLDSLGVLAHPDRLALLHRDLLAEALRFATAAAALTCTRPGADSPSLPAVTRFLAAQ